MTTADVDAGPVPEDNLPGHHPDHEQDQPDLTAMAERLGAIPPERREPAGADVDDGARGPDDHEDRSVAELVEANVAAGLGLGAGLVKGGLAAGGVVAGSAIRQVGRRIGLSR